VSDGIGHSSMYLKPILFIIGSFVTSRNDETEKFIKSLNLSCPSLLYVLWCSDAISKELWRMLSRCPFGDSNCHILPLPSNCFFCVSELSSPESTTMNFCLYIIFDSGNSLIIKS